MATTQNSPPELAPETPVALHRVLNFVNSRPIGYEPERFTGARATEEFLAAGGFDLEGVRLSKADVGALVELRTAATTLLDPATSESERAAAWRKLDAIAVTTPVAIGFTPGPATSLRPAARGVHKIAGQVLADIHSALAAGQWERMRLCAFEPCGAAFYDATRSRNQRWHSYAVCGNRANVAAHRARQRS